MNKNTDIKSEAEKRTLFGPKQKIILIAISFLILLCVDFSIRLIYPTNRPISLYQMKDSARIYFEDFSLGWKLIPGLSYRARYNFFPAPRFPYKKDYYSIYTNSIGLRNIELENDRAKKRVLCIGDSITFGWGVEQIFTYSAHLGWMLNAKYPGQFEVINAGIPGYSSRQGLVFYLEKLRKLKPEYLIISFGANDSTLAPIPDKYSVRYRTFSAVLHKTLCMSKLYTLMRGNMLPLKKTLVNYNEPAGKNEFVRRVSEEDYYENLKAIVNTAIKDGCKPILLATTEDGSYSQKMSTLSGEKKIHLVKGYLSIISHKIEIIADKRFMNLRKLYIDLLGEPNLRIYPGYFQFVDPVHPSSIGHKIIAENLFEKINLSESED